MLRPRFLAGLALAGPLLAFGPSVGHAATVQRSTIQSAVMACQASTPTFDASLRKKPIGVDNVGTGTAYVTCGMTGDSTGAFLASVFSLDSDLTTFSSTELATINTIWAQVAEDYAPFNIDVTTVMPAR